jgi:hypothetical protein
MAKLKKVLELAEKAGSEKIEIWTSSFIATGDLFQDKDRLEKGIVTLQNAKVTSILHKCDSECGCDKLFEWLNIFEDQIIAFTIIK